MYLYKEICEKAGDRNAHSILRTPTLVPSSSVITDVRVFVGQFIGGYIDNIINILIPSIKILLENIRKHVIIGG
jgi:hypothetical protein